MSKISKQSGNGNANPNDVANDLIVSGRTDTGVTMSQAWDIAESADVATMEELSAEYFSDWKQGQQHTFLVTGFGVTTMQDKPVEVVQFQDRAGRKYVNGDKTFYSGCKRLDVALPCFVKAVYEKDIKGDKGTYRDIRVFSFAK